MGFWVGVGVYLSLFFFLPEFLFIGSHVASFFFAGALSSGTCYFLGNFFDDDGIKLKVKG
jgi:hypothetical protein